MHFAVTWDYRCPFARNFHEHLLAALEQGAPWEVDFVPFSLLEVHLDEGDPSVILDTARRNDILALTTGMVVRDAHPEQFPSVHRALFAARHDEARDLTDPEVIADALASCGLDADAVLAQARSDGLAAQLHEEHHRAVERYQVFGVPTVIFDDGRAAFVRLMNRPGGDGELARRTLEAVLAITQDHPELNELKFTTLAR